MMFDHPRQVKIGTDEEVLSLSERGDEAANESIFEEEPETPLSARPIDELLQTKKALTWLTKQGNGSGSNDTLLLARLREVEEELGRREKNYKVA